MPRTKAATMLSLALTLFVPAVLAQDANQANPGTVNYIEGQANLNGQELTAKSAGHAVVETGQTIETGNGKAEVLLTPGVFLRLGSDTSVTMISPDLTATEVRVDQGVAEVEVDQIYKQNHLLVDDGTDQAELLQRGLYEIDANSGTLKVFDGKAAVSPSQNSTKWITVKGGHELALNGEPDKTEGFRKDQVATQDALYNWSKLRSEYLGQANLQLAEEYSGGPAFYPGWAWDPAMYGYTWMPGDGLFWNPFGFGFYSPAYLWGGGFVYPGYGFRGGYYRGGYGFREGFHGGAGVTHSYVGGGARAGFAGGGFHGGGFAGGGFHGGGFAGGGFHGGGGRR